MLLNNYDNCQVLYFVVTIFDIIYIIRWYPFKILNKNRGNFPFRIGEKFISVG